MVRLFVVFLLFSFQTLAQNETVLSWVTKDPRNKELIDLGTHGSIQLKYFEQGKLPDLFVGLNEEKYQWFEDYNWELFSSFSVDELELKDNYILSCNWIDTYCSIFINEELVYKAENAFHPHELNISRFLKKGENEIKAVFSPPILYHKDLVKYNFTHPAPNDTKDFKTSSLTRKPQYQFGWDWAPRMNTLGFIKKVEIVKNPKPVVKNFQAILNSTFESKASVEFVAELSKNSEEIMYWTSKLYGKTKVEKQNGKFYRPEIISNAKFWNPIGYGEQDMYSDTWTFTNANDEVVVEQNVKFALKKSELIYEEDEHGKTYHFKINGNKVFCKGANYIPQDIFPSRVSQQKVKELVLEMADANFNMIRVWGGGYYPDDYFYELCDSLGIMVWQDFMFACAMYPGDHDFVSNISEEVTYQVKRLSKHPTLVQFNGNNEVDVAWGNWGFQSEYKLNEEAQKTIQDAYNVVFKDVIPDIVHEHSEVSYIHTSPLSNWGKPAFFKDGTMHYWGVWHGKDPISDLWKKTGRFNAEFGFQSFPSIATVNAFSDEVNQSLESEVMNNHQKSYVGNTMILKHSDSLFGTPHNFKDFVYKSQLTQALAIGKAITAHRLDFPRCGGTLFWQFNDCWPAPSWSSIDYFNDKKALQYKVRMNFASIAVVQDPNREFGNFVLINETNSEGYIPVKMEILELDAKVRFKTDLGVYFKKTDYQKNISFDGFEKLKAKKNYLIKLTWKGVKGETYSRKILKTGSKGVPKLKLSEISAHHISYDSKLKKGTIKLKLKAFAQSLWISHPNAHVNFETNFESKTKGEYIISYSSNSVINTDELEFHFLNQ